jgi:tRNA uridine 5-carboxymethylaminomethyl modification enzyme
MALARRKEDAVRAVLRDLEDERIDPTSNERLQALNSAPVSQKVPLISLLKRPEITIRQLLELADHLKKYRVKYDEEVLEQAEIQVKYDSYIRKEEQLAEKMTSLDKVRIHDAFNYDVISSLSSEGKEKLKKIRPETLGQASRISGVSPADISIIMVHIGR